MSQTLAMIQSLSNERQHLWRKAGKQKLTADQRLRLRDIPCRLERLWHEYRCEIVKPKREFIEDRMRGDVFCDFIDRMRRAPGVITMASNDWDGENVASPNSGAILPVYEPDEPPTDEFMLMVLREVVAYLRTDVELLA